MPKQPYTYYIHILCLPRRVCWQVIPYSIQNNDAHLAYGSMPGMADAFFDSIKNSIDTLLEEGRAGVSHT